MSSREQVEQTADRLRVELLATLEELDRRRHEALDVRRQLTNHLGLFAGIGVGAVVVSSSALAFAVVRRRNRRARKTRNRVRGFVRAWEHPEWVAAKRKGGHFLPAQLARRVALSAASVLATRLLAARA